jgi:dUTP pyrophosphatase
MSKQVKIKLLENFDSNLALPSYESSGSAGADVRACLVGDKLVIAPHERILIPTGLAMEIPKGFEIQVRPRSGISLKTGLMIVNSPGTIDSDYRGELKIIVGNISTKEEIIKHGDRIAQLVLAKVEQADFFEVEILTDSVRGSGGLGSTGRN